MEIANYIILMTLLLACNWGDQRMGTSETVTQSVNKNFPSIQGLVVLTRACSYGFYKSMCIFYHKFGGAEGKHHEENKAVRPSFFLVPVKT